MTSFKPAVVPAEPKVQNTDVLTITIPMINRMKVEDKSEKTITSYVRAVERLVRFHDLIHPRELDIDEVLDFLVSLNEENQINWRTSKMYPDDKCQDKLLLGCDITGLTFWKMMNLPIRYHIPKSILVYQKFLVEKNFQFYFHHVIMKSTE